MNAGIYASVAAQASAERQLESITANLANLSTTGFKRLGTATQSFDEVLNGRIHREVSTRQTVDYSQGLIDHSGIHTDLALTGPGFFTVESSTGEAYTRNGRLKIGDDGVLQTHEGFPVAWTAANSPIDPRGQELTIDGEGTVFQGELRIGQLVIKDFENPLSLNLDQLGYLHPSPETREMPHQAQVIQGGLERSNVSPIEEMTQMIIVQRRFENAARMLAQLSESYQRLTQAR